MRYLVKQLKEMRKEFQMKEPEAVRVQWFISGGNVGEKPLTEEEIAEMDILGEIRESNGMIKLENDIWLNSVGDGTLCNSDDEDEDWGQVELLGFDENDDLIVNNLWLGYSKF